MAIEVFNRRELKFIISRTQLEQMLSAIAPYMQPDKHNKDGKTYELHNLYIDTDDHALIRHSMTRPIYKEKIRIRSYHQLQNDEIVFLEVKKRYKHITNKRRTKILYADALALIETGKLTQLHGYMNTQVVRELEAMLAMKNYHPKTFISYERLAFFSKDPTNDLRLTFDINLRTRRYSESKEQRLLHADQIIMEIKSSANIPLWIVVILGDLGIQKQSFSKYGQEYLRYLRNGIPTIVGGNNA